MYSFAAAFAALLPSAIAQVTTTVIVEAPYCPGAPALLPYGFEGNTTTPTGPVVAAVVPASDPADPSFRYAGCYTAGNIGPDSGKQFNSPSNTPAGCEQACTGYPFFLLYQGTTCICTSNSPTTNQIDPANCQVGCSGNSTAACGGPNAYLFYGREGGEVGLTTTPGLAPATSSGGAQQFSTSSGILVPVSSTSTPFSTSVPTSGPVTSTLTTTSTISILSLPSTTITLTTGSSTSSASASASTTTAATATANQLRLASATPIPFSDIDESIANITLPFPMQIGTVSSSQIFITLNGLLSLSSVPDEADFDNDDAGHGASDIPALNPTEMLPNGTAAPWWNFMYTNSSDPNTGVYYSITNSTYGNLLSVEWYLYNGFAEIADFILTYNTSMPGELAYWYFTDGDFGANSTVGVQASNDTDDASNASYEYYTNGTIYAGLLLTFGPPGQGVSDITGFTLDCYPNGTFPVAAEATCLSPSTLNS